MPRHEGCSQPTLPRLLRGPGCLLPRNTIWRLIMSPPPGAPEGFGTVASGCSAPRGAAEPAVKGAGRARAGSVWGSPELGSPGSVWGDPLEPQSCFMALPGWAETHLRAAPIPWGWGSFSVSWREEITGGGWRSHKPKNEPASPGAFCPQELLQMAHQSSWIHFSRGSWILFWCVHGEEELWDRKWERKISHRQHQSLGDGFSSIADTAEPGSSSLHVGKASNMLQTPRKLRCRNMHRQPWSVSEAAALQSCQEELPPPRGAEVLHPKWDLGGEFGTSSLKKKS